MLWKPQDRGQVEVAPKKQTGGLRVTLLPFEVFRTPIAQRLVQTPAVIEALDVFEDRLTGLGLILELPMPDQFILERTKEALDRGVVVAVALAAHAQDDTPASEQRLVETRRVLVALVAMMQEPRRRAPVPPRHQPRLDDDRGALALTHGPAHHATRIQIQQHGDIQPARPGGDEGEIPRPNAILGGHGKPLRQAIGNHRRLLLAGLHGADVPAPPQGDQPRQAAEAGHPMAAEGDALAPEHVPHLPRPVGFPRLLVQEPHPVDQPLVGLRPPAGGPALPGTEPAATDRQDRTHARDPELHPMRLDKPILHGDSRAKYTAAFFKMSRSSVTRASSRLSRATSVVRSLRAPEPGKAATPRAFKSACHLYRRLRAMPSSRAISDAGRLPLSSSCTASRLNSGLNRFRWPILHLRGTCCPHFKVSVKPGPPQVLQSYICSDKPPDRAGRHADDPDDGTGLERARNFASAF